MSKSTETADDRAASKQQAFEDAQAARKWVVLHPIGLINRRQRRKMRGRGFNGGALRSQVVKPARPSGVALASPNSRLGKAQRS